MGTLSTGRLADTQALPFPSARRSCSDEHQPFEARGQALETPFSAVSPEEAGVPSSRCPLSSELLKPSEVTSLFLGAAIYNF